jgi:cytochrome c peroxidase
MTRPTIIHRVKNSSSLILKTSLGLVMAITLSGCNTGSKKETIPLDNQLSQIITQLNLNQHPQRDLPIISEALPQLGKKLFFSKGLGGDFDSACVTCHHPALGGADQLSLSVGVDANNPDL